MPPKPLVVVLAPTESDLFLSVCAHKFKVLKEKIELREAFTSEQVRRYVTSTVRPHAVIVADSFVTIPSYRDVLVRLVDYARSGGTVIYAGLLSSSVSTPSALNVGLEQLWELPWRTGPHHRETFSLNTSVRGINHNFVPQNYSMTALFLANVELQHAIYLEPANVRHVETGPHGRAVYETPAAFAPVGQGYFGYIGDVNQEGGTIRLLLAMCLRAGARALITSRTSTPPLTVSSISNTAADTAPLAPSDNLPVRRKVLLLSIHKHDWIDETYSQLYRGLMRNAYIAEACDAVDANAALLDSSPPDAVVVTDAAITEVSYSALLQKLVDYTNNGGTLIFGVNFSTFFPQMKSREFFQRWKLSWSSGDYYRTTFALNPAGVPSPLSSAALVPSFSMKALHLKDVPAECAVYYATSDSHLESLVYAPTKITPKQATQTPAAFAPVGKGFLGYIGDVNGEQGSIRLTLEMCGVRIRPGDMGTRKVTDNVTFGPGGRIDTTTRDEEEIPLPAQGGPSTSSSVPAVDRPREAEVRARAAARDKVKQAKVAKADKLKEEGNEFFKQESWAKAAERYREAALIAGPQPIYVSNLAAALLKLEEWEAAESAASRALRHDPKHIKSLYRRALARKALNRYLGAVSDLSILLDIDEQNEAASKEFIEVESRINVEDEIDELNHDEYDYMAGEPLEVEVESDTEDMHIGNGTPCKFYNHNGCRHGNRCRFKHAPDSKSVRDDLGRNVCVSWLVGECRFGDRCVYAHEKIYLPARGWWTNKIRLEHLREKFDDFACEDRMDVSESILPEALKPLPWRYDIWVHPSAEEKAKALVQPSASTSATASGSRPSRNARAGRSTQASSSRRGQGSSRPNRAQNRARGGPGSGATHGHAQPRWGHAALGAYDYYDDGDDSDGWYNEIEELMLYCGHTRSDYEEMLLQGMKPWDEIPGSISFGNL
ncbi:hypothetical protein L226DRAFT_496202 [Lentinus tigrinus ALCF2SS1-7]|uniref:C3H1-type domain-containing protein n=1 Tax=Lentinus tigrinus ALCF2SS1-6 TaxID=1328759 RepID=A0A5C2RQ25_9APHY|nr:hypothetical protein L227DRAFT_658762 [Lentinus tigrinus ALCF2SS1-6]RPD67969.1 hypothetical protein L226DRAFT_496202 [Lentinus tigrinus ALCF2SS1-7]